MIIARTPFRVSFFGGGTDYPAWCKEHKGIIISTTINKYCYIMLRYLPPFFKYKYRIRYRFNEKQNKLEKIKHPTVRECLRFMAIENGIELVHTADLPARSGIGSSSAFTVCFLHALNALNGDMITKRQLANDAIHVEQDIVKENIGCQDQIAASFGGLNKIELYNDYFKIEPIVLSKERIDLLQDNLMLFFTGFSRTASDVAGAYVQTIHSKKAKELESMYALTEKALDILSNGSIDKFGALLNDAWELKKSFSDNITNKDIDSMYTIARNNGALGGKICGAGGGGFLLLYVKKENQDKVKMALKHFLHVPFKFENLGSQIIMYHQQDF